MNIESLMYFGLGVLVAGLITLMIMPAIWRRAVRLTKKRIEAATPITLAEFRADKDQLRAEFALSTRRLEMNVEQLRKRLAEQLGDVSRKRSDLGTLRGERDEHLSVVRELEEREADLRSRILELERQGAELAQQLKTRERELVAKDDELSTAREAMRRELKTLADRDENSAGARQNLVEAEVRIANAGSRLTALVEEGSVIATEDADTRQQSLADRLSLEAQVAQLREKVLTVESTVVADWDTERVEQAHLRERLNDIASDVSRLVYAVDTHPAPDAEESLFDRVQRFADDGKKVDVTLVNAGARTTAPARSATPLRPGGGGVSDRMAALRELQGRN